MKRTYIPPCCRAIQIDSSELLSSSDTPLRGKIEVKMNYNAMDTGYGDSNQREGGSNIWGED